ncbi:PspA-associated protein PspAB [Amycolatopsis benzoatilytica]|uniref:PspA-associated protein PspAB n=1 Tax=Amycolatopsis benzoatilytica TaxID=346045 RepID=UPI00036083A8|nr:hypothetical protein [Amycolatopsis benzoatilytica]
MGFFDALLGRSAPVPPDLDVLFTVPGAADTLQAALGFAPTGAGAVCFKPAEGGAAAASRREIGDLLSLDPALVPTVTDDEFGYTWVTCRQEVADVPALVTGLHAVNAALVDAGFGSSLLCTVLGFRGGTEAAPRRLALVYLFKRGSFYPFAPTGDQRRDTSLELQARAAIGTDLPIEPDLSRWFALWDAPVP